MEQNQENSPIHNKEKARFYMFNKENTQGAEPSFWKKHFDCKMCPKYTDIIHGFTLFVILLLVWGILYAIVPNLVEPGGKLFDLSILVISAYLFGHLLFKLTTLPALIGMLLIGILYQNINWVHLDGEILLFTSELRKIALVIILTRAGLSLDQPTVKRLLVGILKLGLLPWIVEFVVMAIFGHFFLNLPWNWSFLLSCIIASVSPAVVVPCFIRLQNEGYGLDKGIPTLVLASASIDDTTSIAVYGIISSIMFSKASLLNNILQVPITVIGGVGFGVTWGFFVSIIPDKNDALIGPLRVALLFLGGYGSLLGFNSVGYSGGGPLGIISAAFVAGFCWSKQGWNEKDNPAINSFKNFWMLFEPILFGLTGTLVKFSDLDPNIVGIGTACLFASVFVRIISTIIICFGSNFNFKEKLFIGLSWMAKATVQAALGPLALYTVISQNGSENEIQYASIVLMICILSIALTAPIGALLISVTGPRLLSKSSVQESQSTDQRDTENKDSHTNTNYEENCI